MQCRCCSGPCKKSGRFQNRVVQRFACKRCGSTFSETQPLNNLRLDQGKVVQIVKLLTEGLGVRATARFVGCDPHTVLSVLSEVGTACERLRDKIVRNVTTGSVQIDELWSRVAERVGWCIFNLADTRASGNSASMHHHSSLRKRWRRFLRQNGVSIALVLLVALSMVVVGVIMYLLGSADFRIRW